MSPSQPTKSGYDHHPGRDPLRRLLITGVRSGSGKTTLSCAILAALKARSLNIAAFKCGPDYIDPMFHRSAMGVSSYNLDPFFMDVPRLRAHLARHGGKDFSLIEGAMGYYDGIAFSEEASAYTVAAGTETPVVLVLDGIGNSACALVEGFINHRPDSMIQGVIFNNANERLYQGLRGAVEKAGIPSYGFLPRRREYGIESRHLGLMTTAEIPGLPEKLSLLGQQAEQTLDLDGLLALSGTAPDLPWEGIGARENAAVPSIKLGVARDEAFCFHYAENLELFEELGCELVFFSPIRDKQLPPGLAGLYLAGGYPEVYSEKLSENRTMREAVRQAIAAGIPTIAECGGFLYLHETLDGLPMAGVIAAPAFRTGTLQRFGYITLKAQKDNVLCRRGDAIKAHEFHYWESGAAGEDWIAAKAGRPLEYPCAYSTQDMYAGFPHLYLYGNPGFARNFTQRMRVYHQ